MAENDPFLHAVLQSILKKLDSLDKTNFRYEEVNELIHKLKITLTSLHYNLPELENLTGYHTILNCVYRANDLLDTMDKDFMRPYEVETLKSGILECLAEVDRFDLDAIDGYVMDRLSMKSPENIELPPHLIPCFAYCSLYPQGHRIVREVVVNQWMAEEFLYSPTSSFLDEMEDIGNRYFNELLSRGLFQDPLFGFGYLHSCEMRPREHHAASRIAGEQVSINPTRSPASRARYIAFHQGHLGEHEFNQVGENLYQSRTFMYFGSITVINPAFQASRRDEFWSLRSLRYLRVLDLSGSQFENLPDSLCNLEHLRYLGLSRNGLIRDVSFISYTSNLQTLAVDGCIQFKKLPMFLNSRSMRHLYLTSNQKTLSLSSLPSLRVVELSHCKWLKSLEGGFAYLTSLRTLRTLRTLRIFDCPRLLHLPSIIEGLPRIEELVLHNCASLDLMVGRCMNNFPRLKHLEIIGLPKLVKFPAGLQSASNLQYFMVANCIRLQSLTNVLGHLRSLHKLHVSNCPNLSDFVEEIHSLTNLQSIHIAKCPNLKSETCTKEDRQFMSQVPEIIFFQECLQNQIGNQKHSSSQDVVAAPRQLPSLPYFILKSQTLQSAGYSEASMLDEEYDPKIIYRWGKLSLVVRAITTMKALVKEANEKREELLFTSQVELCLHCSLFPRDYEFERETLILLWMAAGFLKGGYMENVGNKCFNKLLERHVISTSRIDVLTGQSKYKVNLDKVDGIPNVENAKKEHYTIIDNDNTLVGSTYLGYWHVSLVSSHIGQTTYETLKKFSELRTLLFIHDYGSSLKQLPSGLFLALKSLEALDLSGSHIIELPSSIGYVNHLRYLDLSFTKIKELPESIDRLHELQTLKLKGCNHLFALPKRMKELINLRYLEFDVLGQLSIMPRAMGALTRLRTLSAFIVDVLDGGCNIRELKYMNQLSGSLCISGLENARGEDAKEAYLQNKKGLTQLQLRWNDYKSKQIRIEDNSTIQNLRPNNCLQELHIMCYRGSNLPDWISNKDYANLVSITLLKCENRDLNISLKRLPNLKYLGITEMNRVRTIGGSFCGDSRAFPKLEELAVDGMSSLQYWMGIEFDGFPCLSKLSLKHCPKLTTIPPINYITSLKHLEISNCPKLKSISRGQFTSLETLIIDDCALLKEQYSKGGEDWHMIELVPNIWIDLHDIHAGDNSSTTDDDSD